MMNIPSQLINRILRVLSVAEQRPFMLLTCLMIGAGLQGSWANFPLTGALTLSQLQTDFPYQILQVIAVFLLIAYCIAVLKLGPITRVLCATTLFFLLLYCATQVGFLNAQALWQYTEESRAIREIQYVLTLNTTPNAGRSLETSLVFDAFRITERFEAGMAVLAWGAKLSLLMAFLLVVNAVLRSGRVFKSSVIIGCIFTLFFFVSGLGQVALAYLGLNMSVRDANSNNVQPALERLDRLADLDPVLTSSKGFALLSSYLYYISFGPEDVNANAYRMNQVYESGAYHDVIVVNSINQQRHAFIKPTRDESLLRQSLFKLEKNLLANAYLRQALLNLTRKQWADAEDNLQFALRIEYSLVARMLLTIVYEKNQRYDLCVDSASRLLEQIKNVSVVADIWTTKGDCLFAQGLVSQAREAYIKSIALDSNKNYRAVKALSGT